MLLDNYLNYLEIFKSNIISFKNCFGLAEAVFF